MGPYCRFCDRRCFLPRVIDGRTVLLATCRTGMAHDRQQTAGHDHRTALNPVTGQTDLIVRERSAGQDLPCGNPQCGDVNKTIPAGNIVAAVTHQSDNHDRVELLHETCLREVYGLSMTIAVTGPHAPITVPPGPITECPECGCEDLRWDWTAVKLTDVADGRLRLNEVTAHLYLGCEECSETLIVFDADQMTAALNAMKFRPRPHPARPQVTAG